VAELLRGRLDGWLDTPVCRFAEQLPFERVVGLRRFARERTVALLHSPRTLAACRQLAGSTFDRLQDRPFRHLAAALLPDAAAGPLTERTVAAVRAWLCTPAGEQTLTALCHGAATSWLDRPVGRLASRLPADLRAELEQQLLAQLTGLLRAEVPPLVEALGVERMVEEKVNALDVLQVEELLLAIMREQFTWINLFGALLGGLIGGLNLLLLQLT